ncbi:hypothetical protein M1403_01020 [Patescibacteria group bacterium]|nr:hypothetical protein [Patescibacteria group bacterium]
MTEKVIGYFLLAIGIIFIIVAALSVFQVFTGAAKPVQLFQTQGIFLNLGQSLTGSLPAQLTRGISSPSTEIIPASLINDSANLFAHIVLMGFLAGIGQKLASLGIQLIRPIVVKLNER